MKAKELFAIGVILVCAAGCTLAPKYTRPESTVLSTWPDGEAYAHAIDMDVNMESGERMSWREFYTDPNMQQVIELALENNLDLRLAVQNVEFARSLYGIQRDTIFPAVSGAAAGSKQKAAIDLTKEGYSRISEQYSVNLGILSWEVDFFGRIQSLKDNALEQYFASEQARRSAQLLLISGVADTYMALAADRANLALAKTTLESQQASCNLVQRQYEVGIATELELRQAQIPLFSAQRDIARYTQLAAQDINALTLLTGTPIPGDLLPVNLDHIQLPEHLTPGLPSEVLLQRPDVMQAEFMLKAANANIGAARAALFPRISLTGLLGFASSDLTRLFDSGNGTWSFSPQITAPVFDPRSWSALKASKVQYQMVVTQYEKTVQKAFREVADALALCGTVDQQFKAQQSLVDALEITHRLAQTRYEKGVDSYLGVLDAQRSLVAAQQALVSLHQALIVSRMRLFSVLGGGLETEEADSAAFPDVSMRASSNQ